MSEVYRYQLAVGRGDLLTQEYVYVAVPDNALQNEMLRLLIREKAPMPTPRFTGNVLALERLADRLDEEAYDFIVETQDLNVVRAFVHSNRAAVDCSHDEELGRLFRLFDKPLMRRHATIRLMTPFDRLNIHKGAAGALERLDAVYNHSFVIYPCAEEDGEDTFEVRFGSPKSGRLAYERFLDWGAVELDHYIDRAVLLGDSDRLSAEKLAELDPLAFWAFVLRYRTYFTRLARLSADPTWANELRDAVHSAGVLGSGAADEDGRIHREREVPTFTSLLDILTTENIKNIAETGFVAAMPIVLSMGKVKPGSATTSNGIQLEVSHKMRGTKVARMLEMAQSSGTQARATTDEEARSEIESQFNRQLSEITEHSVPGGPEMVLVGQCALCTYCGKREKQPGLLKLCSRCREARYCDKSCQRAHWTNGHKQACGTDPNLRPEPTAVRVVIFPADPAVKPYASWIKGAAYEQHMQYVASNLLTCKQVKTTTATLGELDAGDIVMLHSETGRVNARACAVAAEPIISSLNIAKFELGHDAKVRGDAVVVRLSRSQQQKLNDFSHQHYLDRWGVFSYVAAAQVPNENSTRTSLGFALPVDTSEERVTTLVKLLQELVSGAAREGQASD